MKTLSIRSLSFKFERSDKKIIDNLNTSFPQGWTGLVGPNGCGKSTLLKLLAGKLQASSGTLPNRYRTYYCEQESIHQPPSLADFLAAHDREARRIKTSLSLHDLQSRDWSQLSCGEQKRFQLGCALWDRPDLLLIDEPTNHLDEINRDYIIQALREFPGIGVLVSHDRDLLDAVCSQCLFFVGDRIYEISGSYSEARRQLDQDFLSMEHEKENIRKQTNSLQKEASRLNELNLSSKKRLSKNNLSPKDRDKKSRINLAKLTGKDASFGQKKQNIQNRITNLSDTLKDFHVVKDYSGDITFGTVHQGSSKLILFQEEGSITLPSSHKLYFPELSLTSTEKIGVVGENGIGKSSLIHTILNSGCLKIKNYFYLRQELYESDVTSLRTILKDLDQESYVRCLQIIARLGSDAKQIFNSENWSAGEIRKVAIACAIVNNVELLILDEPTNHLDLPSIENLQNALGASKLTLLVVSHDKNFVRNVCTGVWKISKSENEDSFLETLTLFSKESF